MQITEDSLFEVLDSNDRKDEIGQIYTAKDLMDRYAEYKKIHENDRNLNLIEPFRQQALENNDYSEVKWGRLEDVLDYKLSEPGEVEKQIRIYKNEALELLDFMEYTIIIDKKTGKFNLVDEQKGYLGGEDSYKGFDSLGKALARLESHFEDYIYKPLEERISTGEKISEDDWDLNNKKLIEDEKFWEFLDTDYCTKEVYKLFGVISQDSINTVLDEVEERNRRIEELKKITPFAFDANGKLLSIKEQNKIQQRARSLAGQQFQNFPFIVMENTKSLNIKEFKNQPLIITRKDIKHIIKKHGKMKNVNLSFDKFLDIIENLTNEIQNNQIVFQLPQNKDRFCLVLEEKSENNNNLITIVEINKNNFNIDVSEIITLFGKEQILEMLTDSIEAKCKIYTNERTGDWLAQFRDTLFLTDGNPSLCATKQHLLDLYYKQNNIKSQPKPPKPVRAQVTGKNRVENKTNNSTLQPTKQTRKVNHEI